MTIQRLGIIAKRLAVCLMVALGLVFGAARPSYASLSPGVSDDGMDYGWLYRRGDYLCHWSAREGDVRFLEYFDGEWYWYGYKPHYTTTMVAYEFLWNDGVLRIERFHHVRLDTVIAMGDTGKYGISSYGGYLNFQLQDMNSPFESSSHSRLKFSYRYGDQSNEITHIVIDKDVVPCFESTSVSCLDYLFMGLPNLESVEGLEYVVTDQLSTMAHMFSGCRNLEEIDLSSFDTTSCTDFGEMFEGCTSLTRLVLGEGWSQQAVYQAATTAAVSAASASAVRSYLLAIGALYMDEYGEIYEDPGIDYDLAGVGSVTWVDGKAFVQVGTDVQDTVAVEPADCTEHLATFPVAMTCERDGQTITYQAGEVIPDGPGVYETAERVRIDGAVAGLYAPDGTEVPGVTGGGEPVFDYTGEAIEPVVWAELEGMPLEEGRDFKVSYRNNVETGTAEVIIRGINGMYGQVMLSFDIVDDDAWALLYHDGLLCLKHGHGLPGQDVVPNDNALTSRMHWFSAGATDGGVDVPWSGFADEVKRVVIDESFASFAPVTMSDWFAGCSALTSVDGLQNIDTTHVISMAGLFRDCAAFKELDLSGLRTSGVSDFSDMLSGCTSLERIVLGNLDLTQATSTDGFLAGCDSLKELVLGEGWADANDEAMRLALPGPVIKTNPSYERLDQSELVPAGAGTYRVSDLAMQFCTVEMEHDSYTCTDKPIKPKLTVKLGDNVLSEGADYAVAYANNVTPGKAKVTVTGRGIFTGGLVVPFSIRPRPVQLGERLSVTNASGSFVVKVMGVAKNGLTASARLVRVQAADGVTTLTLPERFTIGGVRVSVTEVGPKLGGEFKRVKTIVVGAGVTTICPKAFSKARKVKTLVVSSTKLKDVNRCLAGSSVKRVKVKARLSSAKRRTYRKWFSSKEVVGRHVRYSYG